MPVSFVRLKILIPPPSALFLNRLAILQPALNNRNAMKTKTHAIAFFVVFCCAAIAAVFVFHASAQQKPKGKTMSDIRLMTLDPGHFHAALVQKEALPGVSPQVHVYAPLGF